MANHLIYLKPEIPQRWSSAGEPEVTMSEIIFNGHCNCKRSCNVSWI